MARATGIEVFTQNSGVPKGTWNVPKAKFQNQDYSSRISNQMHVHEVPICTTLQVMGNNNIQEMRDRMHLLTDMLMFSQIFSFLPDINKSAC